MSKTSQAVWTILQIAAKDSEFHKVLWTCKESAEDPASNFRLWISKHPPALKTALILLATTGTSMHYLALSQILLRRICVATAWEQFLGSFCGCCFHNTAALDNNMSANCRTSCPRYKRPTSYLWGIAQFINTRTASSQVKSSVLSHPEFWISHVENMLWIWHRALHCAYSQSNPKQPVRKGRGHWPAQAGRGTAGEEVFVIFIPRVFFFFEFCDIVTLATIHKKD